MALIFNSRDKLHFYFLAFVMIVLLSGCKTERDLERALFGPSDHDRRMAELDRRDAENQRLMATIDGAIQRHHQVSSSIELGQSKKEVLGKLLPTQVGLGQNGKMPEAFTLDGKKIEIYYMRSARIPDGNKTDDEFTPYSFVDGTLTAIGWRSLGGVKTYGDTTAAQRNAQRNKALATQLLLGHMGQQQQQRQHQDRMNLERKNQMQRLLRPPLNPSVQCRTQYFGNSSRTVCN